MTITISRLIRMLEKMPPNTPLWVHLPCQDHFDVHLPLNGLTFTTVTTADDGVSNPIQALVLEPDQHSTIGHIVKEPHAS